MWLGWRCGAGRNALSPGPLEAIASADKGVTNLRERRVRAVPVGVPDARNTPCIGKMTRHFRCFCFLSILYR